MSRYAPSMIKHCRLIIIGLLLGIIIGVVVARAQVPGYITTTTLSVTTVPTLNTGISQMPGQGTPTTSAPTTLSSSLRTIDPISESVNDVSEIPTRSVMDYVYKADPQLKKHKISVEAMTLDVVASNPSNTTPTILLTVTAPTVADAVLIANDVARNFVVYKDKEYQTQLALQRSFLQGRLNTYQAQSTQLEQQILQYTNPSDPHIALLNADRVVIFKEISTTQTQLAQLRSSINSGIVIRQVASPTTVTTSSKSLTYGGLIAAGGLLSGVLLWLLMIFLDYRLQGGEQIPEKLGLTYVGTLAKNKDISSDTIPVSGRATQQLADIAVNLRLSGVLPDQQTASQGSILLITSTQSKQGTTTVATGLAAALARSGRSVLVIDGNLHNPSTHQAFGLAAGTVGLSGLLQTDTPGQLDAVMQRSSIPGLWFLPGGPAVDDAAPLLEKMPNLLAQARKKADVLLIDGSPLLSNADAGVLSTMVDGVAIVIGHEKVDLLLRAKAVLKSFTHRPIGIIMNRVRSRKQNAYYAAVPTAESATEEKVASLVN